MDIQFHGRVHSVGKESVMATIDGVLYIRRWGQGSCPSCKVKHLCYTLSRACNGSHSWEPVAEEPIDIEVL